MGAWEHLKVLLGTPRRLGICGLVLSGSGEGTVSVHVANRASCTLLRRCCSPRAVGLVFALHSGGLEKGGSDKVPRTVARRTLTEAELGRRRLSSTRWGRNSRGVSLTWKLWWSNTDWKKEKGVRKCAM